LKAKDTNELFLKLKIFYIENINKDVRKYFKNKGQI